ncbi:hypothetical protein ACH4VX_30855 [Streptomyces sp. NPDC020731]|uniref:LmrA/YxaF family transcription factor n=1 Tax=Streptomyces sp. NPDC020731 TaxID=3365085 RepID=UPI00378DEFB9
MPDGFGRFGGAGAEAFGELAVLGVGVDVEDVGGTEAGQAAQLATLVVAAVEGTVAMCRAKRSTRPLDHTAEQLQALIAVTVGD